jgi:hypothetical protein
MKKTNYIILIIFFLVSSLLPSCKKFLDKKPIDTATDANFWNNEAEASAGVAGAYALLRTSLSEKGMAYYFYGDYPTDEFMNNVPQEDYPAIGNIQWTTFILNTQTFRALIRLRSYDNFYRGIDAANRCIKFIPTIPLSKFTSANKEATKNTLIAEAYFLRAFTYFYISRVWGDVPLVTETIDDAALGVNPGRTPQATVLDQCIKDLETAIPNLSWVGATATRPIRANKGTAYALLAHIYAWRGDYAKVIPAADSVILKGGYTPVSKATLASYQSIYKGNSAESIFEIAKNSVSEGAGGAGDVVNSTFPIRILKAPYLLSNTGNTVMPLDAVTVGNVFPDSNDYRRRNGFAFFGTTDPVNIKYAGTVTYPAGGTSTVPVILGNIVIFRLQDIQLLKAEAAAATNDFATARTILGTIRTQANAQPSTATDPKLFEAIIEERERELFLEGHRFYDLIRLGKKTGVILFNGNSPVPRMTDQEFAQGKYYWPIDPLIMSLNPSLIQTPYWRDK